MISAAQFDSMESAVAYYEHYSEAFSGALSCTSNQDCPRHGGNTDADRERIAQDRDAFMADMCRVLVDVYWRTTL